MLAERIVMVNRAFQLLTGYTEDEVLGRPVTLRLSVIAEGVETVAQLAFLSANDCDSYQGYLFSPPLPPAAFARLLAE